MKQKTRKITAVCLTAAVILSVLSSIIGGGFLISGAEEDEIFTYSKDFTDIDVSQLNDVFTAAAIADGKAETGLPSDYWSTEKNPDSHVEWDKQNDYLKPVEYTGKTFLLTLKDIQMSEFTAKLEFLNTWKEYGIIFGQSSPTDTNVSTSGTNGAVKVTMHENAGKIRAEGVKPATAAWLSAERKEGFYNNGTQAYDTVARPDFSTTVNGTNLHTMNIEVKGGKMTLWWDGYEEYKWSVELDDKYIGGYISLYSQGNQQGGIKSFSITGPEGIKEVIDGANCDFTALETLEQLDDAFDAYLVKSGSTTGTAGNVSEYWTTSVSLDGYVWAYQNPWLKPKHRNNGDTTLLTYNSAVYTDTEVKAEFVTNYVRYGIMVAPAGELATAENGIRAYVESDGTISIEGAVDAGSASAIGGQVRIGGKNWVKGYPISGFVSPSSSDNEQSRTSYHLIVRILNGNVSAWLEEFPDYMISAPLTDDFTGGSVSLYSTGYDQGAFKSVRIEELQGSDPQPSESVYYKSFNTTDKIDENEFSAYYLGNPADPPEETAIGEAFRLDKGRLVSNLDKAGDDKSGFAALTLKNKRYENFELTLRYEQDWKRYGVMFGTEMGEFAFKDNGAQLISDGGAIVYTEAEGYRDIKGALYSTYYTEANNLLCRVGTDKIKDTFTSFGSVDATINNKPIHTLKIRVVGEYMAITVDNDASTRVTVRMDNYDGGYISLITNSSADRTTGAICSVMIEELGEDAELETDLPIESGNFQTLDEVEEMFDAYYLEDAEKSTELERVELKKHWRINNGGFLARNNSASGIKETSDIEMLTYSAREFYDFELTYTYQQTYQRLGIVIGGDNKTYPLSIVDGRTVGTGGSIFYVEAEGYPNAKGDLHNYTSLHYGLYRITDPAAPGFMDANNNATDNVNARKVHSVKIIVKDKMLYAFIDGRDEPYAYVKLGDAYDGGYVSIFSGASNSYGFGSFTISENITTPIPAAGGAEQQGDEYTADFDTVKFDSSGFTSYYLEKLSGNSGGDMTERDFDDMWTAANGTLNRSELLENGSDAERVAVLTYNKRLTDFVVTYEYQKSDKRLMFLFGAEKGKYPLSNKGEGDLENGGVILYPENDFGAGGGLIALGGVARLNMGYRPVNSKKMLLDGYHVLDPDKPASESWTSNFGTWHTMTIAVINGHCYIYLDDYGMIADYALAEGYNGGYISFASSGNGHGFDNIRIRDLSSLPGNAVIAVENPHDISVKPGSEIPALPDEVKVTLKNGSTASAEVSFSEVYWDADTEGAYRFTAMIEDSAAFTNPGKAGAVLNVRVKQDIPQQSDDYRYWSFDTDDDLSEFKSAFVTDAENGYSSADLARWFTNDGKLSRDEYRTQGGSSEKNVAILTYTGSTYKNFELEVEYTQHYNWVGVLFGSKEPGQYIDLNDVHSAENPTAAYVEYEGVRNFMGNIKNTNYYSRTDETIYNAREDIDFPEDYYTTANGHTGNVHKMKLRVVGDQAMLWFDDQTDPFVAELTNYEGGYISLFSTAKGGHFDNLEITRLDEKGNPVSETAIAANGKMNLQIDPNASTELVIPKRSIAGDGVAADENEPLSKPKEDTAASPLIIALVVFDALIIAAFAVIACCAAAKMRKRRNTGRIN